MTIGESGTDDLGPHIGLHGGEFVHDDKIETVAANGIGAIGATERDGAAAEQTNGRSVSKGRPFQKGLVMALMRSQRIRLA